ncbi:7,8-didemethyl-8-hydroxy-5-deazariboflavin synthase subunit CofG [Aphanothece hegewaldii CCALA 016]|uniref:7,8-didemethyl-8-hydroxy-5-deazariboflavin synthase n=1 Tax=Aphanothece hegewaldii CCALA 016 TaxID=2107694 RepID=A0A2T1LX10_9CHRO|nr:7,8-didemethyl-8-hydroxy-5-deazariboflavin synthase subunit CofG [Aphanothece hegewaldii]PSF36614.1 7,8-didemethyl-8-hydroxy-5-deazariboflavin synthase subunit CofG [Aphanothece hegewaldii CCALA 016]
MLKTITYSPSYTLVPTYECFNRCTYCNFRVAPSQDDWLSLSQAQKILHSLQPQSVSEILILSGEVHPQSPRRKAWFQRIYDLCQLSLDMGFFPHTNAGPLSYNEMAQLKQVNVSMGLMLEQITPKLLKTVHHHAPSKIPEVRLQQLEWAGELKIPFTTGLLLGIGETETDRWDTLEVITAIQSRWGHIQEVILQPHCVGSHQSLTESQFTLDQFPDIVKKAREILPESIAIQIPPNLISSPNILLLCLEAGATDLGGISPKDEVNPDYPHLLHQTLVNLLESAGWKLIPRLPVYPHYYDWLSPSLRKNMSIR